MPAPPWRASRAVVLACCAVVVGVVGLRYPSVNRHAVAGVENQLAFLDAALDWVADHTPRDLETRYLKAHRRARALVRRLDWLARFRVEEGHTLARYLAYPTGRGYPSARSD